jgi:FkbM family methyltransferase
MEFYSQVSQDRFLFERFFFGKRNGVFVDIGAYDGEKFSNSLFFERFMGWRGLCVEPQAGAFEKLKSIRNCHCEQVCVADFDGEAEFLESTAGVDETMLSGLTQSFDPRHEARLARVATASIPRRMPVVTLSALLEKYQLHDIDYCSIDVEGGELGVLAGLDFDKFRISILTIENNYDDERIPQLMAAKGYEFVAKLEQDYVFRRKEVLPLPLTTVFCAVWHGDAQRLDLLRAHADNLARQTVPVRSVYVFDGGDTPPDWLAGSAVTSKEDLTIYQAWNLALSAVRTPLVMNLNLDDRLASNAVELMQNALLQQNAVMVGGDWKICYTQAETDATGLCEAAETLPFGPATMWRMDAHLGAPRYPWRFADGSLIRSIGDAAWWHSLGEQSRTRLRIPLIVGNYHSHPSDQAEFRNSSEDEFQLLQLLGYSLV